jgi:copper chaperone CopZ
MIHEKTLKVSGMSCNACVRHITKALSGIQGLQIKGVDVGLARIAYDDAIVRDQAVIEAVRSAGYDAQLVR